MGVRKRKRQREEERRRKAFCARRDWRDPICSCKLGVSHWHLPMRVCLGRCPSVPLPRSLPFLPLISSLPSPLTSSHWDHKLLNIKPCFQSVRRGSRCQGPSDRLLHLRRHLGGKICLCLCISLSLGHICIIQAPTYPQGHAVALPFSGKGCLVGKPQINKWLRQKTIYIFPDNLFCNGPVSWEHLPWYACWICWAVSPNKRKEIINQVSLCGCFPCNERTRINERERGCILPV